MTKRERTSRQPDEGDVKQRKLDCTAATSNIDGDPEAELKPFMDDLDNIQKALQDLDEQCARKQMEVQKEFDLSKKPILERRQTVLDKIPGFWATALRNHHMLAMMAKEDESILRHLKRIELDDNLDDAGSYRIKFIFADEVKKYFTPLELVKEVRFSRDGPGDEEVVEATHVIWADAKNNPVTAVMEQRIACGDDSESAPWSIFEWFTKELWPETRPDLGELIRREIWHSPVAFYLGDALSDDGEDGLSEELDDQSDSDVDNDQDEED